MREILFRAKTLNNKEWVEGFYVNRNNIEHLMYIPKGYDEIKTIPINCGTLGQYTGLEDKNGKRIFEGDIVKYVDTFHLVVFERRNNSAYFGVVFPSETWPFGYSVDLKQVAIIGNIYENPELWKVKE